MKILNIHLLPILLVMSFLSIPFLGNTQTTFLEDFLLEFELREVEGIIELPNGNFCAILREEDLSVESSRIQSIYLFDPCGRYIERVQFLNTDEYVDFFNIGFFQDHILVLGYFNAGDYLMMLDPDDLSVVKEIQHLGWSYRDQIVNQTTDGFGYLGLGSDNLNYSTYNQDLDRIVHLEKQHEDDDIRWLLLSNATKENIFYMKTFSEANHHEIGIADYSLNEIATIPGTSIHGDLRFEDMVFSDDSTFYTRFTYSLDEGQYYRKYILDSLVFEKAINPQSSILRGQVDIVEDGFLKSIYSDGMYRVFDIETAELITEKEILPEDTGSLSLSKIMRTNDGGTFIMNNHWTYTNNTWKSFIRLIKLDANLELDLETPSACISNADDVDKPEVSLLISPNPGSGLFSIDATSEIESLDIYNTEGHKLDSPSIHFAGGNFGFHTVHKGLLIVRTVMTNGSVIVKKVIVY